MLSAIWSADWDDVRGMPAREFLGFMKNHGLLHLTDRPQWRVIEGGSHNYVEPLVTASKASVHTKAPIKKIVRHADHVEVQPLGAEALRFDHVVMAVHSEQALRLLADATDAEREVLEAIPYQPNEVDLHFDRDILPKSRHAWASWNYRIRGERPGRAGVTYHMNRLQSLRAPVEFCVTLNQRAQIHPGRVIGRYEYAHPIYRASATRAQARFYEISGSHRTHFCGAYWGHGFHEDGVRSALAACRYFHRGSLA
jgi:predicted NAD/FAD-binding protein